MKLKRIQHLICQRLPLFYTCTEVMREKDGTYCAIITEHFGQLTFTVKTKKKGIDTIAESLILKASLRIESDDYWLSRQNPEMEEYEAWLERT